MQKIVVLNPKGGAGKTTLATNLASLYATRGMSPLLIDYDSQASSLRWAAKRPEDLAPVKAVDAFRTHLRVTRSWHLQIPATTGVIVVDTPAGLDPARSPDILRGADYLIVPILPSDVDIHASSACLKSLLDLRAKGMHAARLLVVANRVPTQGLMLANLKQAAEDLGLPLTATLRDSQHYVLAAEQGAGIFDFGGRRAAADRSQWHALAECLIPERSFELTPAVRHA